MHTQKSSLRKPAAKGSAAKAVKLKSPVEQTRNIPSQVKVLLAARSGGRCQFYGCNKDVFMNPLTMRAGNFSEHAHIVAFSEDGARGKDSERPLDINSADNLMLLCAPCHKEIDDEPEQYTTKMLKVWKKEHEERIAWVTSLGPEAQSTILKVVSKIGDSTVTITSAEVAAAIGPNRYPSQAKPFIIDLTESGEEADGNAYYSQAANQIQRITQRMYEAGMDVKTTGHISLFALAPIPLLIHLGRCLTNKVPIDFYQAHRDAEAPMRWRWKDGNSSIKYALNKLQEGENPNQVALILSLSRKLPLSDVPDELKKYHIYELGLDGQDANNGFLNHKRDLDIFRATYRASMENIRNAHPNIKDLVLLPAIPSPIAVACGYDLLPKVHPRLLIYDKDKTSGGFVYRLAVNA